MNVVFNCLLLDLRSKKNLNGACLSFWKRGIKCDLCSKTFISFYFDADWLVLTLPCSIHDNFFFKKNLDTKRSFQICHCILWTTNWISFQKLVSDNFFSTISKRYNFSVKMCIVFESSNMMWVCASVVNWIMHYFQGEVRT